MAVVCRGVPEGSLLLIDCHELTTGPLFQGIHSIPDGIHVLVISSQQQQRACGERAVVFFKIDKGNTTRERSRLLALNKFDEKIDTVSGGSVANFEVDESNEFNEEKRVSMVLQWDDANETLVNSLKRQGHPASSSPQSYEFDGNGGLGSEAMRSFQRGVVNGDLNGMGPFPISEDKTISEKLMTTTTWSALMKFVNEKLLNSIGIAFGDVIKTGDETFAIDEPIPSSDKSENKFQSKDALHADTTEKSTRYNYTKLAENLRRPSTLSKKTSTTSNYIACSDIVKQESHESNDFSFDGEAITKHNLDFSAYLVSILRSEYNNDWGTLLGEMSVAFVMFVMSFSIEGFCQWKKIVELLCGSSCTNFILEMGKGEECLCLYKELISLLIAQMQLVNADFFQEAEDILGPVGDTKGSDNKHFLVKSLERLIQNIDDEARGQHVGDIRNDLSKSVNDLKKLMRDKFGICMEMGYYDQEFEPVLIPYDELCLCARDSSICIKDQETHNDGKDTPTDGEINNTSAPVSRMEWMLAPS